MSVPAGTTLFEANAPASNVYFVHRGQVRVYQSGPDDSTRLIEILGPNDWTGSAALAGLPHYTSRAVTVTPAVVSEVAATKLLDVLSRNPEATIELIQQLASKVRNAREDAALLVFDDCNNRLVKTLLRFSRSSAATPAGNGEDGVVLRITHQQLAQAVGVARETVSLALTQLRQQKLLRTGRNQLTFNPETLRRFEGSSRREMEEVA
jgi:CRP/FNR family cyclic AMP-dependent transcriptional regulator